VRIAFFIASLALASPATAELLNPVPFVACPRDGQSGLIGGPIKPPTNGVVPQLPPRIAAELAFYSSEDAGILAPRGWRCVGLYGSSGFQLIVAPQRIRPGDFLRAKPRRLTNGAIEVGYSYGATSGRLAVAEAIARYFPARPDFITKTKKLFEFDIFGSLPAGPHRNDYIVERSKDYVRIVNPPRRAGAGTERLISPSDEPVVGIRRLIDSQDGPDLLSVNVRVQGNMPLTNLILSSVKVGN
jgi:hypothetical protein